jgi:elongation factor Ts
MFVKKDKGENRQSISFCWQNFSWARYTTLMFVTCRRSIFVPFRSYSTANAPKVSTKLIAELRKRTDVSLSEAHKALTATDNDVETALQWLRKEGASAGARKAAKVQNRIANEGLIGVSILSNGFGSSDGATGIRAAMVEVNCETDFVARNPLFTQLVADIAYTTAHTAASEEGKGEISFASSFLDVLQHSPLLTSSPTNADDKLEPRTVEDTVHNLMAQVGEKVSLRRAMRVTHNPPSPLTVTGYRLASYLHGGYNLPSQGRIASLALLSLTSPRLGTLTASQAFHDDLDKLERAIARQIVGFETRSVTSSDPADETALYNQPFTMLSGGFENERVPDVLKKWAKEKDMVVDMPGSTAGIDVLRFAKWTVGEDL